MTFSSTLLAAAIAGLISAQFAGGLLGSPLSGGLYFLFAPLPLLLVGFFRLPLATLAAALLGAVGLALLQPAASAWGYLLIIGAPATLATFATLATGRSPWHGPDGFLTPGAVGFVLVLALSVASVFATMLAEPDFARVAAGNRELAREALRMFQREMGTPQGLDEEGFINALAAFGPPLSMAMLHAVFLTLVWFSARLARRAGRLQRPWPRLAIFRLPTAAPSLLAVALILAVLGGWHGLFGAYVAVGLLILFTLAGFGVIHARAEARADQRWTVPIAWIAVLFVSPFLLMMPAILIAGLGLADHVFDFRGLRGRKT
jgi:hypothetical protein